jgi:hypothetical protein
MWVVPKNNSDEYDIRTNPETYYNSSVEIKMITKDFIMADYIEDHNHQ